MKLTTARGQLALLTLITAAAIYARVALNPLQEALRAALSLSDTQVALLQGPALALPMIAGAIPLGWLVDRHSRVGLLRALMCACFVGSVLTAAAHSLGWLAAARSVVGLTTPAIIVAALSILSDEFPPAQRGRATMVMTVGQVGASSLAFAAGGGLLSRFSPDPNAWRWAMLWLAAPLAIAVLVLWAVREPARTDVVVRESSLRGMLIELWRHRGIMGPLTAGIAMVDVAFGATLTWAAPALARAYSITARDVGTLMAVALLIGGLAGPLVGGVAADVCHRIGGPRLTVRTLGVLTLAGVPLGLFALMPGAIPATVLLTILLVLINAVSVAAAALFTIVLPNELRGICMSALSAAQVLFGLALAPVVVSAVSVGLGGAPKIGAALALVCLISNVCSGLILLGSSGRFSGVSTP